MIFDRDQFETSYITINTTKKPIGDVRVRKVINMSINKDRIVRIINGRALPTSQVLPPLMPGYDKAYKGYPYDVEGAKNLMEEAGLKDGFETTLYAMNTDPNPRIAQAIQQDWRPSASRRRSRRSRSRRSSRRVVTRITPR
jgi:ABC-type transport system substrate-binding protein